MDELYVHVNFLGVECSRIKALQYAWLYQPVCVSASVHLNRLAYPLQALHRSATPKLSPTWLALSMALLQYDIQSCISL